MRWVVLAMLLLPFLTAAVAFWSGHRSEGGTRGVSVGGSAATLAFALVVAVPRLGDAPALSSVFTSTTAAGPPIELAVDVDQLSAVMILLASVVSFLVQVYSLGYLSDDPRFPSYTALIHLFTGAMLTVVVADDLWVLLVGWELMGMCSYFLIGHHWELPAARSGAVKAFLMTRTADLGLLFAILVLGDRFGSYRISTIVAHASEHDVALPAFLIVVAVCGKSAQVPFHTWLPDAMPGPTPITALIHAATMVAAGVFLVARVYPLFLRAPDAMTLLAVVAAVTMLVAALYGLVSNDLKRVLAWSTVSQLAYMFGALSVGAWSAGVLHLLAHGAFKALLFLGAGSVIHAVGGRTSMTAMGGLRQSMPDTFATMTVGFAALAGVIPFVGFFTKDAVIHAAVTGHPLDEPVATLLATSMVLTAALTVAYSLRAWLRVFFGPADPDVDAEEPGWVMRAPLYLLAIPSLLGGLLIADPEAVLGERAAEPLFNGITAAAMTGLVAVVAALWVWLWHRYDGADPWAPPVEELVDPADRVYDFGVVRPVSLLARLVRVLDRDVVDFYADSAGAGARGLGRVLRLAQNGNVQAYVMVVVAGAAAVAVAAGVLS